MDKDLSKSPKKKCFEQNTEPWTAEKNRTTKHWVEEDLSKFPIKKQKPKEKNNKKNEKEEDTKDTVKMSRLCKAGLFFLR